MVFRYIAGTKRRPGKGAPSTPVRRPEPMPEKADNFSVILEVLTSRRSVRKYLPRNVDDGTVYALLEAAAHAPSAGNQQPWEFIVVRDQTKKEHIAEAAYNQSWLARVPVIIVACTNMRLAKALYGERGEKLYGIQAVAAAIENLLVAAESKGLSTCWVGSFSEPKLAVLTHCPEYIRPAAIIALGYGAERPEAPILQKPEDYIHVEEYGRTLLIEDVVEQKAPINKGRSEVEYWGSS